MMNADAPDAATWRRLFAILSGDAAGDATVIREFCEMHGVTAAQVMAKLYAHRQQAEERALPDRREGPQGART